MMEGKAGGRISAAVAQTLTRVDDATLEEDVRLQQLQSLADVIASAADTWQLDSQVSKSFLW